MLTRLHVKSPSAATGWRRERSRASLAEVYGSIRTRPAGPFWQKLLAFLGPGYLVATGYMDPGNWATSLAGGSRFGYGLLTVALISNLMAILLQALCARLGIAAGRDLAQACRDAFPRAISWPLWLFAEIAICATDLAEVIGTAIGLNLLFGIPLELGVLITALDVLLILLLQNLGFRWIEALIVTLLAVIALCFVIEIALAQPDWRAVIVGFAPTTEIVTNPDMLYLALGILGATVMPHNLYLHSGIVQTRRFGESTEDRREAITLATVDSTIALTFALTINAAILILAAATFNKAGQTNVSELGDIHALLAPLLGSAIAPTLFGIALICCGLNSTVTATLAGQIVMEGFLDLRLPPWARRLITRAIAIVPAAAVTIWYGESGTAKLLILSQVVLSIQLPFAVVPLILFTADSRKMGALKAPLWMTALAALAAAALIALNIKLVADFIAGSL
ncbi:MAG TPA: Nramp family divalent metal transporter [Xanthobacteraceae bacterium]|nr:Nramp family divalent metal transporter [Xanthobacteraceae bacterium]